MFNSLNAILEIYKKIIINPPTYKINNIKEIHEVFIIKLIIIVNLIDCIKIIKFDLKGDFIIVKIKDKVKLIKIIILAIKIQYIF